MHDSNSKSFKGNTGRKTVIKNVSNDMNMKKDVKLPIQRQKIEVKKVEIPPYDSSMLTSLFKKLKKCYKSIIEEELAKNIAKIDNKASKALKPYNFRSNVNKAVIPFVQPSPKTHFLTFSITSLFTKDDPILRYVPEVKNDSLSNITWFEGISFGSKSFDVTDMANILLLRACQGLLLKNSSNATDTTGIFTSLNISQDLIQHVVLDYIKTSCGREYNDLYLDIKYSSNKDTDIKNITNTNTNNYKVINIDHVSPKYIQKDNNKNALDENRYTSINKEECAFNVFNDRFCSTCQLFDCGIHEKTTEINIVKFNEKAACECRLELASAGHSKKCFVNSLKLAFKSKLETDILVDKLSDMLRGLGVYNSITASEDPKLTDLLVKNLNQSNADTATFSPNQAINAKNLSGKDERTATFPNQVVSSKNLPSQLTAIKNLSDEEGSNTTKHNQEMNNRILPNQLVNNRNLPNQVVNNKDISKINIDMSHLNNTFTKEKYFCDRFYTHMTSTSNLNASSNKIRSLALMKAEKLVSRFLEIIRPNKQIVQIKKVKKPGYSFEPSEYFQPCFQKNCNHGTTFCEYFCGCQSCENVFFCNCTACGPRCPCFLAKRECNDLCGDKIDVDKIKQDFSAGIKGYSKFNTSSFPLENNNKSATASKNILEMSNKTKGDIILNLANNFNDIAKTITKDSEMIQLEIKNYTLQLEQSMKRLSSITNDHSKKLRKMYKCCNNLSTSSSSYQKLSIFKSLKHGLGLFAEEFIPQGSFVIEYTGELITEEEAERRGNFYEMKRVSYLFNCVFSNESCLYSLDAFFMGNKSKFINHSVKFANLKSQVLNVHGNSKIVFYSTRDIFKGEELLFDYQFTEEYKIKHGISDG